VTCSPCRNAADSSFGLPFLLLLLSVLYGFFSRNKKEKGVLFFAIQQGFQELVQPILPETMTAHQMVVLVLHRAALCGSA
jgi:hypothetical protein